MTYFTPSILSIMKSKIGYFTSSIWKSVSGFKSQCPFCKSASNDAQVIDRKYLVTSLVSCNQCSLLYRIPSDDIKSSQNFYQKDYSQGYTTDMPNKEELAKLIQSNFVGSERDYSRYQVIFDVLGIKKDARVLDYGCSWGYGVYQFLKVGYQAEGFEISEPRANFGLEQMNLPIKTDVEQLSGGYDVFFSSHVLEHVADLAAVFLIARQLLKKGGFFIAVTPNGSEEFRKNNYSSFHRLWGQVHPILTNDAFIIRNFPSQPYFITSLPFDLEKLKSWDKESQVKHEVSSWELMFILKT